MDNKKRAALCLSGQMRSLEKTFTNWVKPNIFDCNPDWNIDVFAHTWFSKEDIGKQYQLAGNRGAGCLPIPRTVLVDLYDLYNPKKTLIEKQVDFTKYTFAPGSSRNPDMRLSKMYSIKQSCALKKSAEKEEGFLYDAIIMSRYDLDICQIIIDEYDLNCYNTSTRAKNFVDVTHAIMNSNIFDEFSLLYDEAMKFVNTNSAVPSDERIARKLLNNKKIAIKIHQKLANYSFVRK